MLQLYCQLPRSELSLTQRCPQDAPATGDSPLCVRPAEQPGLSHWPAYRAALTQDDLICSYKLTVLHVFRDDLKEHAHCTLTLPISFSSPWRSPITYKSPPHLWNRAISLVMVCRLMKI